MPIPLVIDVFEQMGIEGLFPSSLTMIRQNLVPLGLADFVWNCGHTVTLEHKTIEQAMTEMGGRLDDQLRKHTQHASEVGLITDGVVTPIEGEAACRLWVPSKDGKVWVPRRQKIHVSWESYQAYLWQLDKEGITIYQAPTLQAMCNAIAAFVHNSLKPEHKSLRRYVKTKPIIMEEEGKPIYWYIKTLMAHTGVGEPMARKLLDVYHTPWAVYRANPLDGLWPAGEKVFQNITKAIGRPY